MDLQSYYTDKRFENGFESACKMSLPEDMLSGDDVLDICCRRGKGAYKISDMVGDEGSVVGIDWNEAFLDEATSGMDDAWRRGGLSHNNMDFRMAYPEDLAASGIADASFDVVYVNSVVNLFFDRAQAFREFARVLKPGGMLIMEIVFADRPHDEGIVEQAREMGNSIQASRTWKECYECLVDAGFESPEVMESCIVAPDQGAREDHPAEVVPEGEIRYLDVVLRVYRS